MISDADMAFAEAWAQELEIEATDSDLMAYLWAWEIVMKSGKEVDPCRPFQKQEQEQIQSQGQQLLQCLLTEFWVRHCFY